MNRHTAPPSVALGDGQTGGISVVPGTRPVFIDSESEVTEREAHPVSIWDSETLAIEARRIGRYLIGSDPPDELIERYAAANVALIVVPPDPDEQRLLGFLRDHPWSLPSIESALGILRPGSIVRRKTLVMMAILETAPGYAGQFDARSVGPMGTLVRLVVLGLSSAASAALGVALYAFLRAFRDGDED